MGIRFRVGIATAFLILISAAGATLIVGNLRSLVGNQRIIVFKDRVFHDHERAQALIQSAQALLYQHQAGYTRDIDRLVDHIAGFERIVSSITPVYRENYSERSCSSCHADGRAKIDQLDEAVRGILFNLDRYRESVSVIITTNDRQARLLHNGIANARGEEIIAAIQRINEASEQMVRQLRAKSEALLLRSERAIEATILAVGGAFLLTVAFFLWGFNRLFAAMLRGTESVTRDDFTHRLPLATRHDEVGVLSARFNIMAEHLEERDRRIGEQTAALERANRQLQDLNENLEAKVRGRTAELELALAEARQASLALEESRRRLEAANRELVGANQAKASFLSIVSHELKTPLSVINGFLSLILDERYQDDPAKQREAVMISKRRGEQLARMIDELIDLSRLDARAMVLRREPVDLGRLLGEVGAAFRDEFLRRQLRFSLRVAPGLPPVPCDPDKVRQVVMNLVANAVKFSPDGAEIELAAGERGEEVVLSCRDTGIGIPPDEQEKIFEKFYQVDASATRRFGGAGLGLSIVKEIVLLHGGRVWVESLPGSGSTFFVALPKSAPSAVDQAAAFDQFSGRAPA